MFKCCGHQPNIARIFVEKQPEIASNASTEYCYGKGWIGVGLSKRGRDGSQKEWVTVMDMLSVWH